METSFGRTSTAEEVTLGADLSGQTWLVTGCNSGLGLETMRVLGMRGAHVLGAARTEDKAREALSRAGARGTPIVCDLSEPTSVRAAVDATAGHQIDGVIANAGIMALPELQQKHGLEMQFLTNHLGHFGLITGVMEQLSDQARVVIVSSAAHFRARESGLELDNLDGSRSYEPWRMYARSKLANIQFARSLARRFHAAGGRQTANSLHPGVIQTNLARHVPDPESMFSRMRDILKTVEQGAATQCFVAVNSAAAELTGEYFDDCAVAEAAPAATDDAAGEALWQRSEELWDALT